jgi:hypothetical protein
VYILCRVMYCDILPVSHKFKLYPIISDVEMLLVKHEHESNWAFKYVTD